MIDDTVRAVLDVGSNTIRLLVARPENGRLETVLDQSEFVRLGAGVDASGELSSEKEEAAVQAIRQLSNAAREKGASSVAAIATSAVRDARNGKAFVERVRKETGVEVEIISGDREAQLTYQGATLGMDLDGGAIVCDLGGGSAEIIAADHSHMKWGRSLQIGSGRLTDRHVRHDPPTAGEQDEVQRDVTQALQSLPATQAQCAIFTGGTATHIAWLARLKGAVVDLDEATLQSVRETVTSEPAAEIARRYGVRPARAQVLPAGVLAVQAIAHFYHPDRMVITTQGIREGVLVDQLESEGAWPRR